MKILNYTFRTQLTFSEPVSDHDFVLRVQPHSTHTQTVLDSQAYVTPTTSLAQQTDGFGNKLLVGRISQPHESFSFVSTGTVMVSDTEIDVKAADRIGMPRVTEPRWPIYLRDSERCVPGEKVRELVAKALGSVDANTTPHKLACALSHQVHETMTYTPGVTTVDTTAEQALELGAGVCQDYAHVLVAACRQAGIAARYVSGLLFGEGATHAWVEIHDGQRWRGLDPTHDCAADCSYIVIAHGRDFADCPIESGILRGGARQSQEVSVRVVDDAVKAAWGAFGELEV
jgi:transglutaminase-like putative cysteine protease